MAAEEGGQAREDDPADDTFGQRVAEGDGETARPAPRLFAPGVRVEAHGGSVPVPARHPVDRDGRVVEQRHEGGAGGRHALLGCRCDPHCLALPGDAPEGLERDVGAILEDDGHRLDPTPLGRATR